MANTLQHPLYPQNLLVDLYELTMAAGYFENHYNPVSTFEVFVREMPPNRSFLVAAGLQQVLEYVLHLKFTEDEIAYLQSLPVFKHVSNEFFDYLLNFRFDGDAWAMPEGQIWTGGQYSGSTSSIYCWLYWHLQRIGRQTVWHSGVWYGCPLLDHGFSFRRRSLSGLPSGFSGIHHFVN